MTINVATGGTGGGGGGGGGDPAGTAAAVMASHVAATDPHAARTAQPSRTQTGNYTLIAADKGMLIDAIDGSAQTFTVPASVFAKDDIVYFRTYGTGGGTPLTFVAGSGLTLRTPASLVMGGQFGTASLHFRSPTEAVLAGSLA